MPLLLGQPSSGDRALPGGTSQRPRLYAGSVGARSDRSSTDIDRTLLRKVKLLDTLKDAGNDAFKNGRLQEAIDKYTEGIEVDLENDNMRATFLSNRATAQLKVRSLASRTRTDILPSSRTQRRHWRTAISVSPSHQSTSRHSAREDGCT